jgi:hypothetical protein
VAILSRVGLDDVVVGLAGAPVFPRPEARAVSGVCGGVRVVSGYVPNGRAPGSEHYEYKLAWLASLREMVAADPAESVVCGHINIAPTDDDVFDPDAYIGSTHVTAPELAELQALGLRDVVRIAGRTSGCSPTGTTAPGCSTCATASDWNATSTRLTGRPARHDPLGSSLAPDLPELRKARGAFFTPPAIAEFLAAWAIDRNPAAHVRGGGLPHRGGSPPRRSASRGTDVH